MDLDTYLATHRTAWERLATLSKGGRRHVRRLSGAEVGELVGLYQQASADLSCARTCYRDAGLVSYLTILVSTAGSVISGSRTRTWRALLEFFTVTFPAAVWRSRRFMALSAALLLIPALATGIWIAYSTDARNLAIPEALQQTYVNHDFEDYYESDRASQFASTVFTNNIEVGIMAFASGLLFGLPTIVVLIYNGISIGVAGGLFAQTASY